MKSWEHHWSGFRYLHEQQCTQQRSCLRCHTVESRTQHAWGAWLYSSTAFDSPQQRACRRCRTSERTQPTFR